MQSARVVFCNAAHKDEVGVFQALPRAEFGDGIYKAQPKLSHTQRL